MSFARLQLGKWGEQCAARYLRRRLYRIVATNYSNSCGEIDIIARRGTMLAFVEVKTRRSTAFGCAVEAVNVRKQRQIIRTAQLYLQQNPEANKFQPRFDVMGILLQSKVNPCLDGDSDECGGKYTVEHITDAFCL
ncbi:MAG: YraN family protein [Desulfuromonas sp.]|nr:YraN family protein [Desulfuromonas sp.]